MTYSCLVGGSWSAQSVQQHAAKDPRQQVQLQQLPLLGKLKWPPLWKAACARVYKAKTERPDILPVSHIGHLTPVPPPQVLIKSFGFSLPPFSKLVVHVRYLCMYLYKYIYTVYVIVDHEMWLLHFIFEGLLFTFSKLQENVTLMWWGWEKVEKVKRSKSSWERALALNTYEDILDGGGVYNN